jgi:hypothetical protein
MNDNIIESKTNVSFYITAVVMYLLQVATAIVAFNLYRPLGMGLGLILICYEVYNVHSGVIKKVTVYSNQIVIDYFLSDKQEVIDYLQISAIKNKRGSSGRQGRVITYRAQEIVLNDGGTVKFNDGQFENYDRLKDAIFRNMVAANRVAIQ